MTHRVNINSVGWFVLQNHDAQDVLSGVNYTNSNRPIIYASRYESAIGEDGVPVFRQASGTAGVLGQFICWPAKGTRKMAQWGSVFAAKITTGGATPKATPVETSTASEWTIAEDLDELRVYTSDGSSLDADTFGLVVAGTHNGVQVPLFFQGGSGGSGVKTYKVTVNNEDGTYTLQEYDYKGGSTVGSPVELCEELNDAPSVPVNAWVHGVTEADGVIRFSLPLGCEG